MRRFTYTPQTTRGGVSLESYFEDTMKKVAKSGGKKLDEVVDTSSTKFKELLRDGVELDARRVKALGVLEKPLRKAVKYIHGLAHKYGATDTAPSEEEAKATVERVKEIIGDAVEQVKEIMRTSAKIVVLTGAALYNYMHSTFWSDSEEVDAEISRLEDFYEGSLATRIIDSALAGVFGAVSLVGDAFGLL